MRPSSPGTPVQTSTATGPHPPIRTPPVVREKGGYYSPQRSVFVSTVKPPAAAKPAPAKGGGRTTVAVGKPVSTASPKAPAPPPLTDEQQIEAWVRAAQLPQMQAIQNAQAAS